MNGLEITKPQVGGYEPLTHFENWRVAVITHNDSFLEENFNKIERHMETDEVFILSDGEATLYIGEERQRIKMEKGVFYNVKKATWHGITTKPGAYVIIVENDDVAVSNSEYKKF